LVSTSPSRRSPSTCHGVTALALRAGRLSCAITPPTSPAIAQFVASRRDPVPSRVCRSHRYRSLPRRGGPPLEAAAAEGAADGAGGHTGVVGWLGSAGNHGALSRWGSIPDNRVLKRYQRIHGTLAVPRRREGVRLETPNPFSLLAPLPGHVSNHVPRSAAGVSAAA